MVRKTYLYDSVIQLQAWLQYYCTNAARLLQFCCTAFAVLLHKPRSTAAKAVQQNCKGCAANVQRRGRKTAKAARLWPNRSRAGKSEVLKAVGKKAGVCPWGIAHGPGTCVLFLPQKTVVRVQSVFALPPCRLAVAFVEGVAGHVATKRQPRCRWQDGKRLRKAGERPSGTRQGGLMSDLGSTGHPSA